jgi:hypothetical protein
MTRATIAGGVCAIALVLLAVAAGYRALDQGAGPAAPTLPATTPTTPPAAAGTDPAAESVGTHPPAESHQGFLYGRIATIDGAAYEGRLRWGGDQEAFWGDFFNGTRRENPWLAHVPPERLPDQRRSTEIFGIRIPSLQSESRAGRHFMVRFGEIARLDAHGREVRVTLKSGTVVDLDRFDASDFDDDVWVWDGKRGVVDVESLRIRTIELLPTPPLGDAPSRLHGTVRTRQGAFSGFVGWDREDCVGSDELDGHTADGALSLPFDSIRSIARRSRDSSLVTLDDGREIVLSDAREVGHGNRGIHVDDRRYGRVLISWDAFERVDFRPGGSGPAYGDFPPGLPLTGSVATRDGRRLAGQLVYDLEESETIETLDAPSGGVDYTIPFGLIASIAPRGREERGVQRASVTLHPGEELQLERTGDLRDENAGMLIFTGGRERPEYVPWRDVERIDFGPPAATPPPLE